MERWTAILTASAILFGFLFAGFWWSLNRELKFEKEDRHFKLSYYLLYSAIGLLATFGIIIPLKNIVGSDSILNLCYYGVVTAIVFIYGYMWTEFGHYSVFQKPGTTKPEWVAFLATFVIAIIFIVASIVILISGST